MNKELTWFKNREKSTLLCITPSGTTTEIPELTQDDAEHCYKMQRRGYTFEEKVTVPRPRPNVCESCEG